MSRLGCSDRAIAARGHGGAVDHDWGVSDQTRHAQRHTNTRRYLASIGNRLKAHERGQESLVAHVTRDNWPDVQQIFEKRLNIDARQTTRERIADAAALISPDRRNDRLDRDVQLAQL